MSKKKEVTEDQTDPTMGIPPLSEPSTPELEAYAAASSIGPEKLAAALLAGRSEVAKEEAASWAKHHHDSRTLIIASLIDAGKLKEAADQVTLQVAAIQGPPSVKSWGKTRGNGNRRGHY